MENHIIGFDPADDPDKTNYCIARVKDGHVHIEHIGTITGRVSSSVAHLEEVPRKSGDDFWKWSEDMDVHAKKIAAAMGVSPDLSGLESHIEEATARHKHYAEAWERRMAGPRQRLAEVTNKLMDKFLRAGMPRPNKFKVVRAVGVRKRKLRLQWTRSYHEHIPTIKWISPTGRMTQSQPARYDIMASGKIIRTPRD